ncbi:MAG: DNA alkylation repair protein, partial [Verrucomicrobiota bacterium]
TGPKVRSEGNPQANLPPDQSPFACAFPGKGQPSPPGPISAPCGMLREAGKRNRRALVEFLELHAAAMPRTMLRYAIEKLPPPERRRWLAGERRSAALSLQDGKRSGSRVAAAIPSRPVERKVNFANFRPGKARPLRSNEQTWTILDKSAPS